VINIVSQEVSQAESWSKLGSMDITELSTSLKELAVKNHYDYLQVMARDYLDNGPDSYRMRNTRGMPLEDWSLEILIKLEVALLQILEYKGLTYETPIENMSFESPVKLMELLDLKIQDKRCQYVPRHIMETLDVTHPITGDAAVFYFKIGIRENANYSRK
jgi:hypothetical protein